MAIQNGTILTDPTAAFTSGTSKTLVLTSQKVANGINCKDMSGADARIRPSFSFYALPPVYNSKMKTWTKASKGFSVTEPILNADGSIDFPVIRVELKDLPSMTSTQINRHCLWAAQILCSSAFQQFILNGALA